MRSANAAPATPKVRTLPAVAMTAESSDSLDPAASSVSDAEASAEVAVSVSIPKSVSVSVAFGSVTIPVCVAVSVEEVVVSVTVTEVPSLAVVVDDSSMELVSVGAESDESGAVFEVSDGASVSVSVAEVVVVVVTEVSFWDDQPFYFEEAIIFTPTSVGRVTSPSSEPPSL